MHDGARGVFAALGSSERQSCGRLSPIFNMDSYSVRKHGCLISGCECDAFLA